MSWNNRIVKRKDGWYAVHEVYYNKDGEAHAMTLEPAFRLMVNPDDPICGCGPEEIRDALKLMLRDVEKDLGERGIFEEPGKGEWADDGYGVMDEEELVKFIAQDFANFVDDSVIAELSDSTKELAQQVADMESEGGLVKAATAEEIEEWAEKLANDISKATD